MSQACRERDVIQRIDCWDDSVSKNWKLHNSTHENEKKTEIELSELMCLLRWVSIVIQKRTERTRLIKVIRMCISCNISCVAYMYINSTHYFPSFFSRSHTRLCVDDVKLFCRYCSKMSYILIFVCFCSASHRTLSAKNSIEFDVIHIHASTDNELIINDVETWDPSKIENSYLSIG